MDTLSTVHTLESLQHSNELPSVDGLLCNLHKCKAEKSLADAGRVHLHACHYGLEGHKNVGNYLVPMFVDCGSIVKAQQVFRQLFHYSEHSWTSLIQGFSERGEWQHGIDLFDEMLCMGVEPSPFTYVAALKACAKLKCIHKGQELHVEAVKKGYDRELFVGNTLVDMYTKFGFLLEVEKSFYDLPLRDVFSWTALAAGYADLRLPQEALHCLERMQEEGISPNSVSYLCTIKACGSLGALDKGYLVHAEIAINGLENVPHIGSALVIMYVKCGSLSQSQEVFDELSVRDVVLWNSLFTGYVELGQDDQVLDLWEQMKSDGVCPDEATYASILKACSTTGEPERGQAIHAECICKGFDSDPYVGSTSLDMYIKYGRFDEAYHVFECLPDRQVVLWTGMMAGYADNGFGEEALACLDGMREDGVLPNPITFSCSLKACSILGIRDEVQEIHIEMVKMGFESDFLVCGSLLDTYVRLGLFVEAEEVFERLQMQDLVSWNILIAGYVEHGLCEEGFKFFQQMQREGISANIASFVSSLKACGGMGNVEAGHEVHISTIKQGMEAETAISNVLVDMYARCDAIMEAEAVFEKLLVRDVISWTGLIQGYANADRGHEALQYFERMQAEGVCPDVVTFSCSLQACSNIGVLSIGQNIHIQVAKEGFETDPLAGNALVDMYAKFGLLSEAWMVFENVAYKDIGLWNTIIQGYSEQGLGEEALSCLQRMQLEEVSPDVFTWGAAMLGFVEEEASDKVVHLAGQMQEHGILPNKFVFANLLMSYGNRTELQNGRKLHAQIKSLEETEAILGTSLVDMYGKCGCMDDSQDVFDVILERDLIAWNALMTGYSRQGKSGLVFHLYEEMIEEGLEPNDVTCLCLLSACQHAGLIDIGQKCLEVMSKELGITLSTKHYACMIDSFGRAGHLNEIVSLMEEMPVRANSITWHMVLSACQRYNDVEFGRQTFEWAASSGRKLAGAYIFMSNLCM